jgi:hypothetical protein
MRKMSLWLLQDGAADCALRVFGQATRFPFSLATRGVAWFRYE